MGCCVYNHVNKHSMLRYSDAYQHVRRILNMGRHENIGMRRWGGVYKGKLKYLEGWEAVSGNKVHAILCHVLTQA